MSFQPLTREQYQKAVNAGFTQDQIIQFEKKRKADSEVPSAIVPQESKETPGALGAVARFTGVDKLGIGLGRAFNNFSGKSDELLSLSRTNAESKAKLAKMLNAPTTSEEQKTKIKKILGDSVDYAGNAYKDVSTAGLSNREVLGSAAQTALNIGLAGSVNSVAAGSGRLLKAAAPEALKTGAGAAVRRIGSRALTGFTAGGALGTAQGLADQKSLGESLKEGLVSGTVGAILGGGLAAGSELVRGLTAPQLTKRLYDSAIGVNKKVAMSGKSPSSRLIKDGVVGTAQGIYDRAQGVIDDVDPKISNILKNSKNAISSESVMATLAHGVNTSVGNEGTSRLTSTEMRAILQSSLPQVRTLLAKDELTMPEVNKLRQIMDKTLGDRAFTGATLPFKKDALYDAANAFRELVKKVEPATRPLFKDYTNSVQTVKALNNELSKPHVLRHMLSLLSATGGGLPGLAAGLINESAQTTLTKTASAVGLDRVNQAILASDKNIAAQLVKRFGRFGALNVIKQATATGSQ